MNLTEKTTRSLSLWIDTLQLITLAIGLTVVGVMLGSRDATLDRATHDIGELSTITQDLTSIIVSNQTTNAEQSVMLEDIRRRIDRLEDTRNE